MYNQELMQSVWTIISKYAKKLLNAANGIETALFKTGAFLVGLCTGAYLSKYIKKIAWLLGIIGIIIAIPAAIKIIRKFLND